MYSKNRRGPRTDPQWMSQYKAAVPDSYLFIDTY